MQKFRLFRLSKGTIIALCVILYVAYCLLLRENYLSSISSIMSFSNHLHIRSHLVVIALLPIYIATMIFGAVMLGLYLGKCLEIFLKRYRLKSSYTAYRKPQIRN